MSKQEKQSSEGGANSKECQSEGRAPLDKQCLSHELSNLLNVDEDVKMTRGQVVKRVWNYIDEHELKEPKNARYIIPDEKMSTVFGNVKFLGHAMLQDIDKHMTCAIMNTPQINISSMKEVIALRRRQKGDQTDIKTMMKFRFGNSTIDRANIKESQPEENQRMVILFKRIVK